MATCMLSGEIPINPNLGGIGTQEGASSRGSLGVTQLDRSIQVQEVEANKERLKKIEEEKERHLKSAQDNAINIRALLRQISSSDKDYDPKIEALSDKDTNLVSRLGKLEDHFYEEQRRVYDLSY
ncbi:unnamed protein product [Arabidopsis thaliana]|uniref:(thale cress) hypothetical protein n=1 Tax=Arabidopsis thaliana TaxID=3702 RepID=A0A7G2FE15_ARATH|nr:unnamed protein product [Arabidopsis thaliana]